MEEPSTGKISSYGKDRVRPLALEDYESKISTSNNTFLKNLNRKELDSFIRKKCNLLWGRARMRAIVWYLMQNWKGKGSPRNNGDNKVHIFGGYDELGEKLYGNEQIGFTIEYVNITHGG